MKPETLKDLLAGGHIVLGEVRNIAKSIFDGQMTAAGPEGYIITAARFDDLPDSCQQFIIKAVLEFKVTNVLDAVEPTVLAEDMPELTDEDFARARPFASHKENE